MTVTNTSIQLFFKRLLLAGIFSFFLFLFAQQIFKFKNVKELKGDFVYTQYTPYSLCSWLEGSYQDITNNFLNENFGFRNYFVRLHNQLKFSLFHLANAQEVIVGKENYMYVQGYINGYFGTDFLGYQSINDTVRDLKFLQDTLASLGKTVLVVMAPGKPRIYPEYLPDYLPKTKPENTNYSAFVNAFEGEKINYIDFNNLFKQKKDTAAFMLFPQLGVHWSRLEAVKAADTIMAKLSQLSGYDLPRIKITKITEKNYLESPDEDIIEGMNLFFYPEFKKMAYPEIEYVIEGKTKKNVLVIADSYWWDIYLRQIPRTVFSINNFWYYNRDAWGNNFLGKRNADKEDIGRTILQNDIIIIMTAESNFSNLGFGFIGAASHALKRPIVPTKKELDDIKTSIQENSKWFSQIRSKAIQRKITVDSMLNLDAHWFFEHNGPLIKKVTFEDVKNSILNNPSWLADLKVKANAKNISIDSIVTENARWYFKNEIKSNEKAEKKLNFNEIIDLIRSTPSWMKQITDKSKQRAITIDSMITLDALWYLDQQK